MPVISLIDSHYLPLPSQGNIYLSAKLQKNDGTIKILVASLRRKIYLVEYQFATDNYMEPKTKEMHFAFISAASEILSLDVFNRSDRRDDFVVAILTKNSEGCGGNPHLNLYSDYDSETSVATMDSRFESVGQSCETFVLEYIPYGLYHAQISPHQIDGKFENIWLIPGHNRKIHAYRGFYSERCHREIWVGEYFPELENVTAVVLCIQILYYNSYHSRITSVGCENGFVSCAIVCCDQNQILQDIRIDYENPISSLNLFALRLSAVSSPYKSINDKDLLHFERKPVISLLVANSLYHSEVFMDILNHGLDVKHCLIESSQYDVCLCSLVADIDFDGNKEIILGTYGEELMVFKYAPDEMSWRLVDQKIFLNPIHRLFYEDLTQDGVAELIIITTKGLHIYQHKVKSEVSNTLQYRLRTNNVKN